MREEVDDKVFEDLPKIVTDVARNRFIMDLPGAFKLAEGKTDDIDVLSGPIFKRLRTDSSQKGNRVENTDPTPQYKMRPRFHQKYYCFDNCNNIDSQVS